MSIIVGIFHCVKPVVKMLYAKAGIVVKFSQTGPAAGVQQMMGGFHQLNCMVLV